MEEELKKNLDDLAGESRAELFQTESGWRVAALVLSAEAHGVLRSEAHQSPVRKP